MKLNNFKSHLLKVYSIWRKQTSVVYTIYLWFLYCMETNILPFSSEARGGSISPYHLLWYTHSFSLHTPIHLRTRMYMGMCVWSTHSHMNKSTHASMHTLSHYPSLICTCADTYFWLISIPSLHVLKVHVIVSKLFQWFKEIWMTKGSKTTS